MDKDLDSSRLFFDPSANRSTMLFLGNNNLMFPGQRTMMSMEENVSKKRPFFTSPDELFYDEEYYYDEQLPEKKRRLTPEQVVLLEKSFEEENKLEPERKSELAKKLGLQPRQVAVWFQNRRARSKTKQLERDYDVLKASYDNLLSNYDTIIKENAMLKTEVHSLTEKLETKEVIMNSIVGPKLYPAQQQLQLEDGPPIISAQEKLSKAEDRQSSGSGGSTSAVENENEDNFKMVMDSTCDSYFGCPPTSPYMAAAVVVQSEEDEVSDDGRSYFPNIFDVANTVDHHHHHVHVQEEEVGQELGWWVWS